MTDPNVMRATPQKLRALRPKNKHLTRISVSLLALILTSQSTFAVLIPNGDFSDPNNEDSETAPVVGLLGNYDKLFNAGPWSASGTGLLDILAAPASEIGSGVATVSGLASVDAGGIVSNSSRFYINDIGTTFSAGSTYTLTASISTTGLLNATTLSDSGVGIGLLADTSATPSSGTGGALLNLSTSDANNGSITYTFTAGAGVDTADIGVELYTGRGSGLGSISVIGDVQFDNVTLSAVPEPSALAMGLGLFTAAFVVTRRKPAR